MTEPEVTVAASILRRHGVQFVVVGGQAIGKAVRATGDVDVMVATPEYRKTIELLRSDPESRFDSEEGGVARFVMTRAGDEFLDVLDAKEFAGTKSGKGFFAFIVSSESRSRDGILYATPAVVWYTRLMVRRWKHYSDKILQDVLGGVGAGRIRRVVEIAKEFGTEALIRDRVRYLRSELQRPDLEYILEESAA